MNPTNSNGTGAYVNLLRENSGGTALFGALVAAFFLCTASCGGDGGGTSTDDDGTDTGSETGVAPDTGVDSETGDARPDPTERTEIQNEDNLLEPGGVAVTDEMGLVAPEGALDRNIAIRSEGAEDPTDETPLPPEADSAGGYFDVSAGRNIDIPVDETPLYLMVPVPVDFSGDPTNLALGVRSSVDYLAGDSIDPSISHVWFSRPGYYLPGPRVLVVPLRFLLTDETTLVLLESDEFETRTLRIGPGNGNVDDSTETTSQGLYRTRQQPGVIGWVKEKAEDVGETFKDWAEDLADGVEDAIEAATETAEEAKACADDEGWKAKPDFYVKCRGFENGGCGESEKSAMRAYLNRVHDQFVPGFREPDLLRTLPCRKVNGTYGRFYKYTIRKDETGLDSFGCTSAGGMYSPLLNRAITCYDPSDPDPSQEERTTRMEYFHAIQYNYGAIQPWNSHSWVLEGTASFVENTETTPSNAIRDPERGSLRTIDKPLNRYEEGDNGAPGYKIQDFWVYLIHSLDSTPKDVLEPLFTGLRKVDIQKIASAFELDRHYWAWVRNQAFESHQTEGFPSDLNERCVPNSSTWNALADEFDYDAGTQSSPLRESSFVSGNWNAGVAKLNVTNTDPDPKKIFVDAESSFFGMLGAVKLYPERNSQSSDCLNRGEPEGESSITNVVESGEEWSAYMLMANNQFVGGEGLAYDLEVDHLGSNGDKLPPTASIERPFPSSNDDPDRRYRITLRADAEDPGGGFIANYHWKLTGPRSHVETHTGNDIEVDALGTFYPGTLTIELTVTDDEGDEISMTVERYFLPPG